MKISLMILSTLLASSAFASNCDTVNLAGNWKQQDIYNSARVRMAGSDSRRTYKIEQNKCLVTITETFGHSKGAVWQVDLSGSQANGVPKELVHYNRITGGDKASNSL